MSTPAEALRSASFVNADFMQVCWVVPDVRASVETWARLTGAGPFWWTPSVTPTRSRYRGQPASHPLLEAAIGYAGDLQIELVCQHSDEPSIFTDIVPRGGSGLHHMALYCRDYEAERDRYIEGGAELALEVHFGDLRTAWVDTTSTLGFMIELLEPSEARATRFASWREAARNWDGRDPFLPPSS